MVERRLLKIKEVAEMLGVGRQRVYVLTKTGVLHQINVGGMRRYDRLEIEKLLGLRSEAKENKEK